MESNEINWKNKACSLKWKPRESGGAGLSRRSCNEMLRGMFKRKCRKPRIYWDGEPVWKPRPPESILSLREESRPAAEMLSEGQTVESIAKEYGVPFDLMLLKIDEWAFCLPEWFKGWFPDFE